MNYPMDKYCYFLFLFFKFEKLKFLFIFENKYNNNNNRWFQSEMNVFVVLNFFFHLQLEVLFESNNNNK